MSILIRKAERITTWEATEPVELNQDSFKLLIENEPYAGETDQDFLSYISDLYYEDNSWTEVADELEELGFLEDADNLSMIFEADQFEYSSSVEKGEESWLESGEVDSAYSKTGKFNIENSTYS
jgi:hypothetical protein|tara:strand:- start:299 stop:670 length:372 start_codon:yes stop_codon:yes gene_type:complete